MAQVNLTEWELKMKPEQIAEIEAQFGEGAKLVHVTPAINEECDHDWREGADGNPEQCTKCGLSFTRYIHCCCF